MPGKKRKKEHPFSLSTEELLSSKKEESERILRKRISSRGMHVRKGPSFITGWPGGKRALFYQKGSKFQKKKRKGLLLKSLLLPGRRELTSSVQGKGKPSLKEGSPFTPFWGGGLISSKKK